MSLLALLGMFKNRAVLYVVGAILLLFGLIAWHKSGVNRAVEDERARLTAAFEQAAKEAKDAQSLLNQSAATDYEQTVADGKVKIEYRTKEVKIYVEKNNRLSANAGVDCRVDADFVSVYNHTSPAAKAAD